MRVLHVITSLRTGGAEKLMVELLPRLRDFGNSETQNLGNAEIQRFGDSEIRNFGVELLVFDGARTPFYEELERRGVKIHSFGENSNVYNPLFVFKLIPFMRQFDVVHTHNTACQFFAAIGKPKGVKLFTTEHSTSTRRRNYRIFHVIDRWMYKAYDQIICISKPSEDSLRGYIGEGYPIRTIQNGVDVQRFMDAEPVDLGIGDVKKITMVAGFRYEKDQPTVIRSLTHLAEDYHLILVGDGEKRTELEALIAELGLTERVHLLGLRNDVPNILKASDVIVMSSHREGLSLSNVEGMASGNPFVASDVEGLREVTKDYGVLFPHGDDKALAEVIQNLCTDNGYREEVVKRCRERALQYDIRKMAEGYLGAYRGVRV